MQAPVVQDEFVKAAGEVQNYVESSTDYLRLRMFKTLMRLVTSLAKSLVMGVLALLTLMFLSLAASLSLGEKLGDYPQGFLWVGGFYLLVAAMAFLLRHRLERTVLRHFSDLYFDEL